MSCNECGSTDIHETYLFPRENLDDKECECLECGHKWDLVIKKEIYVKQIEELDKSHTSPF